jgi:hypothetical protein
VVRRLEELLARFEDTYFSTFPGYYDTMDAGVKDEHGYIKVAAISPQQTKCPKRCPFSNVLMYWDDSLCVYPCRVYRISCDVLLYRSVDLDLVHHHPQRWTISVLDMILRWSEFQQAAFGFGFGTPTGIIRPSLNSI